MHILFLSDNFPPEVNAPASRTFEHCREWMTAGHRVTVITGAPNFPRGRIFDGYRNRLWQSEVIDGIRVIRVWTYISANEGVLKRTLDYVSFMVSAFIAAGFVRGVDVVIGTSPQFFTACAAYAVGLIKRRPWVFELRDLWPESIRVVGAMKGGRVLDALEALELFLYRRATAVVSVTHAFKDDLIRRGIAPQKIHVVTNGVDASRFTPQPKDAALVRSLGLEGCFVAGYIGTHGMAHALDTILDAAALVRKEPDGGRWRFLLLGDGASKAQLERRARAEGLENVIFVPSVPKGEVARYWSVLDAAVIHLKRDDLFRTVIPSKLFEAMGMGLPVLHGVEGESAEIVTRHDVGLPFTPEDPVDLVRALRVMAEDAGAMTRWRENALKGAREFDRSALAQKMLSVLSGLEVAR